MPDSVTVSLWTSERREERGDKQQETNPALWHQDLVPFWPKKAETNFQNVLPFSSPGLSSTVTSKPRPMLVFGVDKLARALGNLKGDVRA